MKSLSNQVKRRRGLAAGLIGFAVVLASSSPLSFTAGEVTHLALSDARPAAIPKISPQNQARVLRNPIPNVSNSDRAAQAKVIGDYAKLPLSFEPNQGQTDPQVKFLCRGGGYTLFLMANEAVLTLSQKQAKDTGAQEKKSSFGSSSRKAANPTIASSQSPAKVVRMKLAGANPQPRITGLEQRTGKVNYFIGNDSKEWRTDIPSFARVKYEDVYPGIDLIYYGNQRMLEYDFVVHPGVQPDSIKLAFEGIRKMHVDAHGELVIAVDGGEELHFKKPILYQEVNGVRESVAGRYAISGKRQVSFEVGNYDSARPLVIDPILVYSSYLGGSDADTGRAIALDSEGNAYVAGYTLSINFPTGPEGVLRASGGGFDIFVSRLNPTGSALVYSTYLGGSEIDRAEGIAVDSGGNAYVTGVSLSMNYPTANARQPSRAGPIGDSDAVVTKLPPFGNTLLYSTYHGGSNDDQGREITVDAFGNAFVTGFTQSNNFPTTASFQPERAGNSDVFVTKFDPGGLLLVYSTFLGGTGVDVGEDIAVDGQGNAVVVGSTTSGGFPVIAGIQQGFSGGDGDAFVAKLDAAGAVLLYSTYLGGGGDDVANAVTLDSSGNAYVIGSTSSTNFPTKDALQPANNGAFDVFVAKLPPAGLTLVFSTYLGGSSNDFGNGIGIDPARNVYLTGATFSLNFPTRDPIQPAHAGFVDAFVTELGSSGATLVYSTYLGGADDDRSNAIAIDPLQNAYVTGSTGSVDFPTRGPFQPGNAGVLDVFIAKLSAQFTFYAPRLMTTEASGPDVDNSEYEGFAFANLGTTNAVLTFTAYERGGGLVVGPEITNPRSIELLPGAQMTMVDFQIFGPALIGRKPMGWVKVDSTSSKVMGSFLTFNGGLTVLDGADLLTSTMTSFVLTEIDNEGFTQVHVVNPNPAAANVTLELYRSDGTLKTPAVVRNISPNGALVESVASLFPNLAPGVTLDPSDHIRAVSNTGVVGFEYLGKAGQYAGALNGQDVNASSRAVFASQYVIGSSQFRSRVSIVNTEVTAGFLTLRFLSDAGAELSVRTTSIPGRGKIYIADETFFLDPGNTPTQGYLEISGLGGRFAGSVLFSDPTRSRFLSVLPLVSSTQSPVGFSQLASNATYSAGLAIVNTSNVDTLVTIQVFSQSGSLLASKVELIPAFQRKSDLLTEYFPSLVGVDISASYVKITADRGIASFGLIFTPDLRVLSALPAQVLP